MAMPQEPEDPVSYTDSGDPVRDGIQRYLTSTLGQGLVVHYVVLVGASFPTDKGWKIKPVLLADCDQPEYVTDGLLSTAPELQALASMEHDEEETEP